jgi:hypothetical protein
MGFLKSCELSIFNLQQNTGQTAVFQNPKLPKALSRSAARNHKPAAFKNLFQELPKIGNFIQKY